jgi:hypothetical protein
MFQQPLRFEDAQARPRALGREMCAGACASMLDLPVSI